MLLPDRPKRPYSRGEQPRTRWSPDESSSKRWLRRHPDAEFGADIALAGGAALLGAPVYDDASGAYLYDLTSLPNSDK